MTIREYLYNHLVERGMFPNQADAVLEKMMQDESQQAMAGRWNESTGLYPVGLLVALCVTTNRFAVEWIDEYLPRAWYRPVFAN